MKLPAFLLALLLSAQPSLHAAEKKPNVIFILTDDQGWNDAHFAGHPYAKTPNLDKFASQSTWLRQFYVAATVCSPSRTAFMTSHVPARHLIHGHISSHDTNVARSMPDWLDPQVTTLPGLLKSAGYATAHFGKWHLGSGPSAPPPEAYGIDVSRTTVSNGKPFAEEKDPYFWAKSTGLIVDETIAFIKAHKGQPFYANVWTLLPHATLKPTPEQLAVYADLAPSAGDPGFGPWMQKYLGEAKDLKSQMQVFCASLTDLDTQLGRLFSALDEMKLAEDTIIFISSDNGPEDYRIGNAANGGVGNTGPLRARKRSMYEGGIRTFGILRWPGHVAAGKRDETSVMGGVDFLPTICKLAGVALPADLQPDGEDVSDMWLGKSRPRTKPLHWEWLFNVAGGKEGGYMPPMLTVRDGDWKLFVNHNGTSAELFNIPNDIGEGHDVAAANPAVVKSLTAKALAWAKALPPSPARDAATASGQPQDNGRAQKGANKPSANPKAATLDRAAIFKKWDSNHDGKLTFAEYKAGLGDKPDIEQRLRGGAEAELRHPRTDRRTGAAGASSAAQRERTLADGHGRTVRVERESGRPAAHLRPRRDHPAPGAQPQRGQHRDCESAGVAGGGGAGCRPARSRAEARRTSCRLRHSHRGNGEVAGGRGGKIPRCGAQGRRKLPPRCASCRHLHGSLIIWVLAAGALYFGSQWNAETVEPYLQIGLAVFIPALAAWMFFRTRRELREAHGHAHSHHSHTHDPHNHGSGGHHHAHDERILVPTGHGDAELSIFEKDTPPAFRLAFAGGTKETPADFTLEMARGDGTRQTFAFAAKDGFHESTTDIPEPHEFDAVLTFTHGGHDHTSRVQFREGETPRAANEAGEYQDAHERGHAREIEQRFAGRTVTTPQIVMFGITGGLMPCPAAFTVLLVCLQLKRATLGFAMVASFSFGLALTMVTVGALAALSVQHAQKRFRGFGEAMRRAPYVSCVLLVLLASYMAWHGWRGLAAHG